MVPKSRRLRQRAAKTFARSLGAPLTAVGADPVSYETLPTNVLELPDFMQCPVTSLTARAQDIKRKYR